MILSIIILFCDKDVQYLKDILSDIKNKIHISHEIILVDNRETNKSDLPEGDYKLISNGKNIYQMEGRRIGLDVASGQFTWFVDVDDNIIGDIYLEDIKGKLKSDIIQLYVDNPKIYPQILPNTRHGEDVHIFGNELWSRFFNTELLKRCLNKVKRGIIFVGYEDIFIFELINDNTRIISYIDKIIYKYNIDRSLRDGGSFTKDKFDKLELGIENLEYLSSFLKNPKKFISYIDAIHQYQNKQIT